MFIKCGHKLLNYKSKTTILSFLIYLRRGTYIHHGTHGHGARVRSKDNLQVSFPGLNSTLSGLVVGASSLDQLIAPIAYPAYHSGKVNISSSQFFPNKS